MTTEEPATEPTYFSVTDPDVRRDAVRASLPELIERIEKTLSEQAQRSRDILAFAEMAEEQDAVEKIHAAVRAIRALTFEWDHEICVTGGYLDVLVERLSKVQHIPFEKRA